MKYLSLVLLFLWLLLLENAMAERAILFTLSKGLEIRMTLLLKILFLFLNLSTVTNKIDKNGFQFIAIFIAFLFFSTLYTLKTTPQYFLGSLAQFVHIFLNFNILIFVYLNSNSEKSIIYFVRGLSAFANFNACLVIISYYFPNLLSSFEARTSEDGITRSFGLMGDEISMFLTFFFYKAIVESKKYNVLLLFSAIVCTGGIGAIFTTFVLIIYFISKNFLGKKALLIQTGLFIVFSSILLMIFKSEFQNLSIISRINQNLSGQGSWQLRIMSFVNGIEMFKQSPMLGVGYGSYLNNVVLNYNGIIDSYGNVMSESTARVILGSTFNPFLQMACESGLIGLFFFIFLLVKFIRVFDIELDTERSGNIIRLRAASKGWVFVFIITCISANWFLPASFLFLLVLILIGLNLRINNSYQKFDYL
jgi:O-antigen ligase